MTILDFALQMEKDGEDYYRALAEKTASRGLKTILTMLADDEVKHATIIKGIKEYQQPDLKSTPILGAAKNIFIEMKEQKKWDEIPPDQVGVYKKAQEIEVKSYTFYVEKGKNLGDPGQKKYFLLIAEEEKRHYFLLTNIIKFVSQPQYWLENAEFFHLDEY